eukprot:447843-Ditylum_brightwellii.AAC.1
MENDLQSISTRQISNINTKRTRKQLIMLKKWYQTNIFDNVKDSLQQEHAILKTAKDKLQRVKKNQEKEHSFIQE